MSNVCNFALQMEVKNFSTLSVTIIRVVMTAHILANYGQHLPPRMGYCSLFNGKQGLWVPLTPILLLRNQRPYIFQIGILPYGGTKSCCSMPLLDASTWLISQVLLGFTSMGLKHGPHLLPYTRQVFVMSFGTSNIMHIAWLSTVSYVFKDVYYDVLNMKNHFELIYSYALHIYKVLYLHIHIYICRERERAPRPFFLYQDCLGPIISCKTLRGYIVRPTSSNSHQG